MKVPYFKFFFVITGILFFLFFNNILYAIEIKGIEIIGTSVDLSAAKEIKEIKGQLSRRDIEALGVKITNEYHDKGYTTSYVEKLVARPDGILEIHVKESIILGVNITGTAGKEKEEIEYKFKPLLYNIYNKYYVETIAELIKDRYNFGSINIYPINYEDTSDVFLSIKLNKKSKGDFYGGIGFEPIYGISPELGYYYPFTNAALNIFSRAGYREGKFRRVEGDLKYFIFSGKSTSGIYVGSNVSMFIDQWESRDSEYKRTSLAPVLGYRSIHQYIIIDLYINEIISNIENYKDNEKEFRDYDSRLTLDLGLSNKVNKLSMKDATDVALSISTGRSNLSEKIYIISSGEIKSALLPFAWLRLIPRIYSFYTTSNQRYFWQYVYDKRLLGFFDDYTASKWKNIGGLDLEFEIIPQFVFIGPFINTGYFLDEYDKWKSKTGTGIKSKIEFKNAYLEIYFAWDVSAGPSEGGLAVLAGGRF